MLWDKFAAYLAEKIKAWGMQKRLAVKLHLSPTAISRYASGKQRPREDNVIAIAKFFGDDPVLLLEMAGYPALARQLREGDNDFRIEEMHAPYRLAQVPIVGHASAGDVELELEYTDQGYPPGIIDDYIDLATSGKTDYAIRVHGDSLEPVCPNGSILIASPESKANPRGLCIVRSESGEVWVKRIIEHSKQFTLRSPNPDYPPIYLDKKVIRYIHPVSWIRLP